MSQPAQQRWTETEAFSNRCLICVSANCIQLDPMSVYESAFALEIGLEWGRLQSTSDPRMREDAA